MIRAGRKITQYAMLLITAILTSCYVSEYEKSLTTAENLLEENPDSARVILAGMHGVNPGSERLRALYILLNTQAQIKNNYWTADHDSLLSAIDYFQKNQDSESERLMKAYYCHADLLQAADSLSAAAKSSASALEIAYSRSDNLWIARGNEQMADILSDAMRPAKAIPFARRAIEYYDMATRHRNSLFIECDIANRYSATGKPAKGIQIADSIRRISLLPEADSLLTAYSLSALAYGYLISEDHEKARDYYNKIEKDYRGVYTFPTHEKIFMARCEIALGHPDSAAKMLDDIDTTYSQDNYKVKHLRYILSCHSDDRQAQLEALRQFTEQREKLWTEMNDISVLEGESEHFRQKADSEARKRSNTVAVTAGILLAVIMCAIAVTLVYSRRLKAGKEADIKEIKSSLDEKILALTSFLEEKDEAIKKLKEIHGDELYKQKWETVNLLAKEYLKKRNSDNDKVRLSILTDFDAGLNKIFDDRFFQDAEYYLNLVMDDIISLLRQECPSISERTIKLIMMCYLGLDTNIISYISGITPGNVYTNKTRIKSRLEKLNPPHLEMFLSRF